MINTFSEICNTVKTGNPVTANKRELLKKFVLQEFFKELKTNLDDMSVVFCRALDKHNQLLREMIVEDLRINTNTQEIDKDLEKLDTLKDHIKQVEIDVGKLQKDFEEKAKNKSIEEFKYYLLYVGDKFADETQKMVLGKLIEKIK